MHSIFLSFLLVSMPNYTDTHASTHTDTNTKTFSSIFGYKSNLNRRWCTVHTWKLDTSKSWTQIKSLVLEFWPNGYYCFHICKFGYFWGLVSSGSHGPCNFILPLCFSRGAWCIHTHTLPKGYHHISSCPKTLTRNLVNSFTNSSMLYILSPTLSYVPHIFLPHGTPSSVPRIYVLQSTTWCNYSLWCMWRMLHIRARHTQLYSMFQNILQYPIPLHMAKGLLIQNIFLISFKCMKPLGDVFGAACLLFFGL